MNRKRRINGGTQPPCQRSALRESRAAMECKVTEVVQFKNWKGETVQGWLVLGEVVAVYIDKTLIKDGVYQTALANPILRAGRGGD